jgi:hypothetical protein
VLQSVVVFQAPHPTFSTALKGFFFIEQSRNRKCFPARNILIIVPLLELNLSGSTQKLLLPS